MAQMLIQGPDPRLNLAGTLNCHPSDKGYQAQVSSPEEQNTNLKQWGQTSFVCEGTSEETEEEKREHRRCVHFASRGPSATGKGECDAIPPVGERPGY
ncbi:hypothetical protein CORC01_08268 [Colletotrichum orchidophilum]|uniref:Uncharacterized protein n=1 Tax=Colletotrichum orchidophilum TaxID=1209926 RepID=A0A1G4B5C9_9PEZI|nr:uncharacterized protein CORC01_08268 [Colletotrichum orchidophilum]OHE96505.1 hypothetical protein CORC01_08268 [Colletotrichum orchidophilum]